MNKVNLEDLSLNDLEELSQSPLELRRYCLNNELDIIEVLENLDSLIEGKTKKKTSRKTSIKTKSQSPEVLAKKILEGIRKTQDIEVYDLTKFVESLRLDMEKEGIELELSYPFEGFVSNLLYKLAEEEKFGENKKNHTSSRLSKPVVASELSELLCVNFGERGFDRISGRLDRRYVNEHYIVEDDGIKFRDSNRELHENPEIEGSKCWSGESKAEVRELLELFIHKYLTKDLESRLKELNSAREMLRKERLELDEELNGFDLRDKGLPGEEIEYKFSGNEQEVMDFKKKFVRNRLNGSISEISFRYTKNHIFAKVNRRSVDALKTFKREWENFSGKLPSIRDNIKDIDGREERIKKNRGSLSKNSNQLNRLDDEITNLTSLNYLSLEGPNFTSYLGLSNLFRSSGIELKGTFVEYIHRLSNIMKSVVNANSNDKLKDCRVINRNIDDLILLDFVKDPNVTIQSNGGNVEVVYKRERISLEQYHEIIDDPDFEECPEEIYEKYDLSMDFVGALEDRYEGKFDIVFLDYLGSITPKKKKVLETLVKRRLNDKAILATTYNASKRVNHRKTSGIDSSEVSNNVFDNAMDIFSGCGYEVNDVEDKSYKDTKDKMNFQMYSIEKMKEN